MSKVSLMTILAVVQFTVSDLRAVEPSEVAVYNLSGFDGQVNQVQFCDFYVDASPSILASDGNRIRLFSGGDGTVLFDTPMDAGYLKYSILLDDLNCDLAADIVVGYYFGSDRFEQDTVCRLELFDGAAGYTAPETLYFEASTGLLESSPSPFGLLNLQAHDITGDGCLNLILGYDQFTVVSFGGSNIQTTGGRTIVYGSFPGLIEWDSPDLFSRLHEIPAWESRRLFAGTGFESFSVIPGSGQITGALQIIDEEGSMLAEMAEPLVSACSADSSRLTSVLECLCVGDIDVANEGVEILARHIWHQTCFSSDQVSFDSANSSLRLYAFSSPDQLTLLWTAATFRGNDFHFSNDYPGCFYSIEGATVLEHSGLNGMVVAEGKPFDADTLMWCENPAVAGGELIAIRDQTVTLYDLDVATDAGRDHPLTSLPGSFALGLPYPNPFNPSCMIEYSLPTGSHVKISIVNVLGREVTTLVDGIRPAGTYRVTWDGTDQGGQPVASGVYLFRMESGEFSQSRKMLLLK